MTTTPVMTITDEQIAEIERDIAAQAKIKHGQCEGGVTVRGEICRECGATPKDSCRRPLPKSYAVPSNITALIYRLRTAEKDASRWRHARNILTVEAIEIAQSDFLNFGLPPSESESVRADISIDAAMEQSE